MTSMTATQTPSTVRSMSGRLAGRQRSRGGPRQGRIAISQLRTDKLEQACDSAQQTVNLLAGHVDAERGLGFLRTFKEDLTPFADTSAARDFTEYAESRLNL